MQFFVEYAQNEGGDCFVVLFRMFVGYCGVRSMSAVIFAFVALELLLL